MQFLQPEALTVTAAINHEGLADSETARPRVCAKERWPQNSDINLTEYCLDS
jgi:hypothetical protein